METQRITIRLPQHDIHSIDANNIIEKAEKIKKVQELELAVESIEPYMKK